MITDAELDAMMAVCEAATAGPWTSYPSCIGYGWGADIDGPEDGDYRDARFKRREDTEFIALSRTALPRLVGELRKARKVNEAAKALRDCLLCEMSELKTGVIWQSTVTVLECGISSLDAAVKEAGE